MQGYLLLGPTWATLPCGSSRPLCQERRERGKISGLCKHQPQWRALSEKWRWVSRETLGNLFRVGYSGIKSIAGVEQKKSSRPSFPCSLQPRVLWTMLPTFNDLGILDLFHMFLHTGYHYLQFYKTALDCNRKVMFVGKFCTLGTKICQNMVPA